jgi:uncharacterized protein YgbK (DUF1537 family)
MAPGSIFIVADDLTGAADCAVQFRQVGLSAVVLAPCLRQRLIGPRAQVVSLNLNTRDASPVVVQRLWERQATAIRVLAQEALVYQKIDSTLRGHPALEVRLLLNCLGASGAIIAPAFPKLGRYTVAGVHHVDGRPLAETEYGRRQRRSRPTSSLPELLTAGDEAPAQHLSWQVIDGGVDAVRRWLGEHLDAPGRLVTADAVEERHLDILTQAALPLAGRFLLVGSAGWAERLALAYKDGMPDGEQNPGALGVVGSLSAMASRQVEAASQAGVLVLPWHTPSARPLVSPGSPDWQALRHRLACGSSIVLWTNPGSSGTATRPAAQRVLRAVAGGVRELLATTPVSGLLIVGGDTAQAVLRALRASGLALAGEVASGVPFGRILDGPFAGLLIATKAGGFGAESVIAECLTFLQNSASQ